LELTCNSTTAIGCILALGIARPWNMRGIWYHEKCPLLWGKITCNLDKMRVDK